MEGPERGIDSDGVVHDVAIYGGKGRCGATIASIHFVDGSPCPKCDEMRERERARFLIK